jgi:hypothetical protein
MRPTARFARFVCGSAVAAALSFGAAQAVASPASAAASDERVCNPQVCDRVCRAIGAFGGFCNSAGGCSCYIGAP